jgi:hypothetical protein
MCARPAPSNTHCIPTGAAVWRLEIRNLYQPTCNTSSWCLLPPVYAAAVAAQQSLQLSGLRVLSSLSAGAAEGEVAGEVLVPTQMLDRLLHIIRQPGAHEQVGAVHCLITTGCCRRPCFAIRQSLCLAGCDHGSKPNIHSLQLQRDDLCCGQATRRLCWGVYEQLCSRGQN